MGGATPTRSHHRRHTPWRTTFPSDSLEQSETTLSSEPTHSPFHLIPRAQITTAPSPTSPPNVVVFELSTLITVQHFSDYYGIAPEQFSSPHYLRLGDGSLIATPLIRDMSGAHVSLFVIGLAFCFFLGNTVTSLGFILGGKIKHKTLLYLLFASQLLASATYISLFVGYMNDRINCTVLVMLSQIWTVLSQLILISGILGFKAYRCLNNSRIVLGVLVAGSATFLAAAAVDMSQLKGVRRLAGACIRNDPEHIKPFLYVIESVNAIFVCCCFIFAIRKSARLPASRGRLSLHYSTAPTLRDSVTADLARKTTVAEQTRGWWDLPENVLPSLSEPNSVLSEKSNGRENVPTRSFALEPAPLGRNAPRKSSIRGEYPLPQPARLPHVSDLPANGARVRPRASSPLPNSPSSSLLSKFMPRVSLFREAMRDELKYTAAICAVCCLSAILAIVGVMGAYFVGSTGWEALNWFVVSRMVMHSFRRVIRRHEEEAIVLKATNWDPTFRRPPRMSATNIRGVSKAWSAGQGASYRRPQRFSTSLSAESDPFEDGSVDNISLRSHRNDSDARSWRTGNSSQLHLIAENGAEISRSMGLSSPPHHVSSPLASPLFAQNTWEIVDETMPRRANDGLSPTSTIPHSAADSTWSSTSPQRSRMESRPSVNSQNDSFSSYKEHPLEPNAAGVAL